MYISKGTLRCETAAPTQPGTENLWMVSGLMTQRPVAGERSFALFYPQLLMYPYTRCGGVCSGEMVNQRKGQGQGVPMGKSFPKTSGTYCSIKHVSLCGYGHRTVFSKHVFLCRHRHLLQLPSLRLMGKWASSQGFLFPQYLLFLISNETFLS